MKSENGDLAALSLVKYLDDWTVKMSGVNKNSVRKGVYNKLNTLSFDLYHVLPHRKSSRCWQYALADWRICRVKSIADTISCALLQPAHADLDPEAHSQVLKLIDELANESVHKLLAQNLGETIEKVILRGHHLTPIHAANLM